MHIILIGFMGAGKSKSSLVLHERLGIPRFSTDERIVERSMYSSIAEIFEHDGEQAFRELETDVLKNLISGEPLVLDTGGGIVERIENRKLLQECGHPVFYLHASFNTVYERVGGDERRPLMLDVEEARMRYTRRLPWYEGCATYSIDANVGDPTSRAEEIIKIVSAEKGT